MVKGTLEFNLNNPEEMYDFNLKLQSYEMSNALRTIREELKKKLKNDNSEERHNTLVEVQAILFDCIEDIKIDI